jgi:tetratricopeptide (TPR) repeat protein
VLVGKINARAAAITITVELVDVSTGWQLWGESFDSQSRDILQIQDAITRQLLVTLRLNLTGAEEKSVTARYTESAQAYQSYLEGRYHWSRYTRKGIEKAIKHFRHAIEVDPNYALAYAGIVDCYLRLATNYLPPDDDTPRWQSDRNSRANSDQESDERLKLRFEWDWKGAERELRRANELKADYPAAHQWYAALSLSQRLVEEAWMSNPPKPPASVRKRTALKRPLPTHIPSLELTPNEEVQIYCAIAREQIDVGNYDAACLILQSWWQLGSWPKLEGLNQHACADLLFTAGELAGCVASTEQLPKGQKHGEALLSGSIAVWEQLGSRIRAAEGRIELALCYYRQGLFDLGRSTLLTVLNSLSAEEEGLRSLALIRLASLERHAGRLHDALARLTDAAELVDLSGPWVTGRCNLEFASAYKDLSVSYDVEHYRYSSREFYCKALNEFEAVGNHRLAAIVHNNLGYLLLNMEEYPEAEFHLLRARRSFDFFHDKIRCAQADDSLAQLYLAQGKLEEAKKAIDRAVKTMEIGDEDPLLAEALTTKGLICCRSKRHIEAKRALEDAHRLASRCGDNEGAGRALLVLMEEMREILGEEERISVEKRLVELLSSSQQPSLLRRLSNCVDSFAR